MTAVAWSPDNTQLATASDDGMVRIWKPTTGQTLRTLTGHSSAVTGVTWSPDGTHLATASYDGSVRIWSSNGNAIAVLAGSTSAVTGVDWSPDGTQLAATDPSGTVTVWTLSGAELTSITIHSATCLAWSSINTLAVGQNEGWPAVFDLATGQD